MPIGFDRLDFFGNLHGAELRCKRRADARCEHDASEQGPKLARKSNCDQTGNQPLRSETLQLVAGQQRHRQPKKKGNQSHERHRIDTGAFGVAKKTGGTERYASALNPLKRFFERVHNEPEHAAYFAKKIARDMADPSAIKTGGGSAFAMDREVASLRPLGKEQS